MALNSLTGSWSAGRSMPLTVPTSEEFGQVAGRRPFTLRIVDKAGLRPGHGISGAGLNGPAFDAGASLLSEDVVSARAFEYRQSAGEVRLSCLRPQQIDFES
jgi:hypothetical protein